MNVGMMWFNDNPKTTVAQKVKEAADYYRTKYGQEPNLCFVHPDMHEAAGKQEADPESKVTIRPLRSILPWHLWIGVDDSNKNKTKEIQ